MSNKTMLIIGARPGSGNIGDGIRECMNDSGWQVWSHDAKLPSDGTGKPVYGVPGIHSERWEETDALVVSLGTVTMESFVDLTSLAIQEVIDACLTIPLQVVRKYVEQRGPSGKGGKIILIGSYAHRHPFTNGVPYCAAKAGLDMAGKVLGWELTREGFHTHVVHPYHVPDSPMWEVVQQGVMENRGMDRREADDYAFKDNKMRLMDPYEIGCIVHMLCTLPEADWLSGTNLELFGGTR
jgi:NAD(P)-dependent dehydrogenase (short-subunit alcohol dehydrogenase family)